MPNSIKQPIVKPNSTDNPIDAILSRHKGVIPEGHPDRPAVVAHINQLNRNPNTRHDAIRLYSKHITDYSDPKMNIIRDTNPSPNLNPTISSLQPNLKQTEHDKKEDTVLKTDTLNKEDKNHPKGGLKVSVAKKLGIRAGIETHREVEKKGGVSKLSDKTKSRRRSFCARHCGMKRKFPKAYKDPQSKGNKALRVWHCGSCSSWLKKSIGPNDKIEFYQDGNILDMYMGMDVPVEIENMIVNSILLKNYVEVDQELNKRCWEGYEPVPGKKPYEKGSCAPVKKQEPIDDKMIKLKNKLEEIKNKRKK